MQSLIFNENLTFRQSKSGLKEYVKTIWEWKKKRI